jgi:hypothetical protein
MEDTQLPVKFAIVFAASAPSMNVTAPIPTTAQSSGFVSLPTGWQAINFTQVGADGVPPWGKDFNGLFQVITAWLQWYQAGGPITYDPTFQAAISPTPGYPNGAIVQSATTPGKYWRSSVDDNITNPDTGGAGWIAWPFPIPIPIADGGTNNIGPFSMGSVIFSNGTQLTQDNANFYWLDSLQRLGIGTNAPTANLDVRGPIFTTGTFETVSGSATAVFAPNGGFSFGGNGALGGNLITTGIVQTNSGSSFAFLASTGGLQIGGAAIIGGNASIGNNASITGTCNVGGDIDVGGNANITGACNAAGGSWTANLDIITNTPNAGIGIVCAGGNGPLVELQTGSGGNTWVWQHQIGTADLTWSFNTIGRMQLDQFGNLTIQGAYSPSDISMKSNIEPLGPVLDYLTDLSTIRYEHQNDPGHRVIGLIANEVQEHFPELVRTDRDGKLSLGYDKLSALSIAAIKELHAEMIAQRDEIAALRAQLEAR